MKINNKEIIEISKDNYVYMSTGEKPLDEEIKCFKLKVEENKQKSKERIKQKNDLHDNFFVEHKQHIVDLLGCDEEEIEHLREHDLDFLVYQFSTALFDCFDSGGKIKWLNDVKEKMGEQFYYDVIEGYVLGNHDT